MTSIAKRNTTERGYKQINVSDKVIKQAREKLGGKSLQQATAQ